MVGKICESHETQGSPAVKPGNLEFLINELLYFINIFLH